MKLQNFLFRFAVVVCLLFAFQGNALAALADSSNHAVSVKETPTSITYHGTLSFSVNDSTSSLFTKALDLQYIDVTKPIILTVHGNSAAAAQDVNVFIEGSDWLVDSTFENSYANATFDDVDLFSGDGVVKGIINYKQAAGDTLATGVATRTLIPFPSNIDPAFLNRFIRVEADGQAGNRSNVVLKWSLTCQKKEGAPPNGAYGVFSVAGGL